jgi:cytochrome c-type protein NapB
MRQMRGVSTVLIGAVALAGIAYAAEPIDDSQLGLEKSSVFDTPTPKAPNYMGSAPFEDDDYARSYPGAPPMIPHSLDDMLPITLAKNSCQGRRRHYRRAITPRRRSCRARATTA